MNYQDKEDTEKQLWQISAFILWTISFEFWGSIATWAFALCMYLSYEDLKNKYKSDYYKHGLVIIWIFFIVVAGFSYHSHKEGIKKRIKTEISQCYDDGERDCINIGIERGLEPFDDGDVELR